MLGAVGVVAVFVFIVTMLLLAIVYHNRRLIHKEEVCESSMIAVGLEKKIIVQYTYVHLNITSILLCIDIACWVSVNCYNSST